ncbi:MAG: chemotaxis protein CheD [Bacillales bacterium]|jgi:chemotaxis protein CheD|nr:chemotaxis protein CheD [Bacillales bacterium]
MNTVEVIKVGIAELDVVKTPNSIRTSGLGSCVGVVIYDELQKIGGLAHVMLPDSSLAKGGIINSSKFADTAVVDLYNRLIHIGGRQSVFKAKIAGGAQMFNFTTANEMMRIGPRNVEAVKEMLKKLKVPIIAEDVGGNSGRTIEFFPNTTILTVRTVNQGVKEL